ncbi:MAG: hypothetical protein H6668_12630 [Ardenticatenaceae bacterium]|nr:hypothetical protein [Ardenticatenaceae bacterium]
MSLRGGRGICQRGQGLAWRGLTCVWLRHWIRKRSGSTVCTHTFYATTGNRLLVDLQVQIGNILMMGDYTELAYERIYRGAFLVLPPLDGLKCVTG